MDAELFSQRYKAPESIVIPSTSPGEVEATSYGNFQELFQSSHAWSKLFGTLLYGKLAHDQIPSAKELTAITQAYQQWDAEVFSTILSTSADWYQSLKKEGAPYEQLHDADSERSHAVFHELNRVHIDQWRMLFLGAKPEQIRLAAQDSKLALAIAGCHYGKVREERMQAVGEPVWFSEEYDLERGSLEGFLQENDVGIVLHDLAANRENNWICLPAPAQFEIYASKSEHQTNANVDFILFDQKTGQVIGVQAKSKVEQAQVDSYDPERVVLVDGRRDLGNEAPKQVDARRSTKRIVSWGGQIATEHLASVSLRHKRYGTMIVKQPGVMGLKQYAGRATKGSTPQMRASADRISERIKQKLISSASPAYSK